MPGLRPISYAFAFLFALGSGANAQTTASASPNTRAQAIAASFSKSKHVTKEKRGVRKEKYLDIRSTPAVRANPASYSGSYEVSDLGFSLQLVVATDGTVEGSGYGPVDLESRVMRRFTLRNARVNGALLTATKVYASGDQEKLEGVFMNRTSYNSPTDGGRTEFGLGVMGKAVHFSGFTTDRFFYRSMLPGSGQ